MNKHPEIFSSFLQLKKTEKMPDNFIRNIFDQIPWSYFKKDMNINSVFRNPGRVHFIPWFRMLKILSVILLLLLPVYRVAAQDTVVVSGIILSGNGQPVPSVSVSIEGSSEIPVETDEAGTFSINSTSGS